MSLISVIVPVYKVEDYLDKCIESIVNQTYKNLEIILVDDGSPDRCPAICDAWAEKDSRIKVIHQVNLGSAVARNVALDCAHGDYISFVDSDDYVSSQFYEFLMHEFKDDVDIVECDYIFTDQDVENFDDKPLSNSICYSTVDALKCHIADTCFKQTIWNKLYRKNMLEGVRFVPKKRIDDEFFTYRVLGNAHKLARLPMKLYAYRQQSSSIMHSINIEQRIQSVEAKKNRHQYLEKCYPELLHDSAVNLVFSCIYMCQLALKTSNKPISVYLKSTAREYLLDIKSYSDISFKNRIWMIMAKRLFIFICRVRNFLKIGL